MTKSLLESSILNTVEYRSLSAGTVPSNEYLIQTVILTGTSSAIIFDNIPQEYRHLKLVGSSLSDNSDMYLYLNQDTNHGNYRKHYLQGAGGTLSSGVESAPFSDTGGIAINQIWSIEIDILDYTNANKNTTSRILFTQGDARISLNSILWKNTSSVNSVRLLGRNHYQHSRFSLYGVIG